MIHMIAIIIMILSPPAMNKYKPIILYPLWPPTAQELIDAGVPAQYTSSAGATLYTTQRPQTKAGITYVSCGGVVYQIRR
jgi:hypothetical protein